MWQQLSLETFERFRERHRYALITFATRRSIAGQQALPVMWELSFDYGERVGMAWLDPEEVPQRAAEFFAYTFLVVLLRDGETVAELDVPLSREEYAQCLDDLLAGETVNAPARPRLVVGELTDQEVTYQPVDVASGVPARPEPKPTVQDVLSLADSPLPSTIRDTLGDNVATTPLDTVTGQPKQPPPRPTRSDELALMFTALDEVWHPTTRDVRFTPVDPGSGVQVEPNPWAVARITDSTMSKSPAGLTRFARELFEYELAARGKHDNLVVAPFAVVQSLSAAMLGARGEMRDQMARTLRLRVLSEMVPYIVATLRRKLRAAVEERGMRGPEMHMANGLFLDAQFKALPEFRANVQSLLQANVAPVDLRRRAEPACEEINAWVRAQSAGKVANVIRIDDIGEDARLVLASAMHLAPALSPPLEPARDEVAGNGLDGAERSMPAWRADLNRVRFCEGPDWHALELELDECDWGLRIVVPEPDSFEALEKQWLAGEFDSTWATADRMDVRLRMPRTHVSSRLSLERSLAQMGMPAAFDSELANFFGISGTADLFLHRVLHHASFSLSPTLPPPHASKDALPCRTDATEIHLARPFLFEVLDRMTDTLMMHGRVVTSTDLE